jgi:hypothetical protein
MIGELKAMLCHLELALLWMKGNFVGFKTKAGLCFRPEVTVRNWTPANTANEESQLRTD